MISSDTLQKSLQGKSVRTFREYIKLATIIIHSVTFTIFDYSSPRVEISFKVIKITNTATFSSLERKKQKQKKNKKEQTIENKLNSTRNLDRN